MESSQEKIIAAIGGVFIYSENPKELAEWYKKHLLIDWEFTEEYGSYYATFFYKDAADGKKYCTVWSILGSNVRPKLDFRAFTVNYRVNNIDKAVEHVKSLGVEVRGVDVYPEGKFAWIEDPEGNHIELWEDTKAK